MATEIDIDALRKGLEGVTPGPWFVSGVRFRMNGGEWHNVNRYDEARKRDENIRALLDEIEALRKLANEVSGLRAFEPEIRAAIGNTNWSVLMGCLDAALHSKADSQSKD